MSRIDGRENNQLRPIQITTNYIKNAEGSCYIQVGNTWVLCNASVEDRVPPFLKGSGTGWVTAEYSMLPRSGKERSSRDSYRGPSGRSHEIQRLIGRSLRSITDLDALGERTITLDCDVLQADGGTRTASITGAFVAMVLAMEYMRKENLVKNIPIYEMVTAVSVGIVENKLLLDLCYEEDSRAAVDMNIVMTDNNRFVEVQGTAEGMPYTREELGKLLDLGALGIKELLKAQKDALQGVLSEF